MTLAKRGDISQTANEGERSWIVAIGKADSNSPPRIRPVTSATISAATLQGYLRLVTVALDGTISSRDVDKLPVEADPTNAPGIWVIKLTEAESSYAKALITINDGSGATFEWSIEPMEFYGSGGAHSRT